MPLMPLPDDPSREETYLQVSEFIVGATGIGDMTEAFFDVSAQKMAGFAALMGMIMEEMRTSDCQCKTCVDIRQALDGLDPNHV